jgi:hypothetical protein
MDSRLIKCWIFSHEDPDGILVYSGSRNEFSIPTDKSFELKSNGEFIQYNPHSKGGSSMDKGRFEIKDHFIYVNLDNPYQDFIFNIIDYDDKILKVRKVRK